MQTNRRLRKFGSSFMSIQLLNRNSHFFSTRLPVELEIELNRIVGEGVTINSDIEARLLEIKEGWSQCVDPYIALFKFYFRRGRYGEAESMVWQAMKLTSGRAGFDRNYRKLSPNAMDWLENDSDQRHYLFCLKALGVIRLRRGKVAMAKRVLTKLEELDPYDEIGGLSYLQIAEGF